MYFFRSVFVSDMYHGELLHMNKIKSKQNSISIEFMKQNRTEALQVWRKKEIMFVMSKTLLENPMYKSNIQKFKILANIARRQILIKHN